MLSWEFDGELVNFELTGLSYAWISVAFSQDQYWVCDRLSLFLFLFTIVVEGQHLKNIFISKKINPINFFI